MTYQCATVLLFRGALVGIANRTSPIFGPDKIIPFTGLLPTLLMFQGLPAVYFDQHTGAVRPIHWSKTDKKGPAYKEVNMNSMLPNPEHSENTGSNFCNLLLAWEGGPEGEFISPPLNFNIIKLTST